VADKKQGGGSNPPRDRLIGQQLGDYKLIGVLATGGMARVYEGVDVKLERHAAVKVLEHDSIAEDQTLTQRFQREARAIAALEHDNIITIYQFGEVEAEGVYFLAMKLIKGNTLANEIADLRLKNEKMDVERALHILSQVASALDFAHEAGIIHRDVKPSNVLLDQGDKAILTDFGLILQLEGVDKTLGTAFGTPRYIAPEQALASEDAVPQSDLYSLGIIAYELLTGEVPFKGESPMEIALSHISDPPPPLRSLNPDIPEEAEHEILKALNKEPEARHQTAQEFIDALKKAYKLIDAAASATPNNAVASAIPNIPIPSTSVSAGDKASQPQPPVARKRRSLAPVFMIAMILVAVIVGVFMVANSNNGDAASNDNPVVVVSTETSADVSSVEDTVTNEPTNEPIEPTTEPADEPVEPTAEPTENIAATEQAAQQATTNAEDATLNAAAAATVETSNMTETQTSEIELATQNAEDAIATENGLSTIQARVTATVEAAEATANAVATIEAENAAPTANSLSVVEGDGAPVTLLYSENDFSIINGGDYTLNVETLEFIRGDVGGGDDFSGDRIPSSELPPGRCYRIVRQGHSVRTNEDCRPLDAGGVLALQDVRNFFWRTEPDDYEHFEVRFEGITIATCNTVARTESDQCHFQWPVGPPS